jgi:hypothetical protein
MGSLSDTHMDATCAVVCFCRVCAAHAALQSTLVYRQRFFTSWCLAAAMALPGRESPALDG